MASLKFLVVDDATFIRDMLKKNLRDHFPGCEIIDASSAKKAQVLLKTNSIDLILCDWEMPEMTGEEFLVWVRGQERYVELPFIMVTSRGEKDFIVKAAQAGVSDYLGKPFKPESLVAKVSKALKTVGIDAKTRLPETAHGLGGGSLDVLTGGGAAQAKVEKAQPDVAAVEAPAKKQARSRVVVRGQAQLTFADFEVQCIIKDISLQLLSGMVKRGDYLPSILEQVVVSIVQNDGTDVARLNGYVHSLQAAENRIDADVLKIGIRFIDDDPQKLEQLSRYIAKL